MRLILTAIAAACGLLAAWPAAGKVSTFSLENGLEAVVIEDHRSPAVTHMIWYRAGAADEPPGKSGVAHFLEHLLFLGTETLEPGEFSKTVAENGGTDNAFTSYDYTAYHQRIASDRLDIVMRMEADRMRNLRLDESDILNEREVILEERSQRVDNNPSSLFSEQRRAALYLNHPYSIPVIGWRHEMEGLELEDALEFYRKYYAPNNAVLVVAGDVTPDEVKRLAELHYGKLEPTPGLGPRNRTSEPPQLSERRLLFSDPKISQPYLARTYLAPERNPGDQKPAASLSLLAEVLGGSGLTSVLGEELQLKRETAVYTSASYSGTSLDKTGFSLVVVPAQDVSLEEAERAMDETIESFLEKGVEPGHLERIKTQIRASEIYARDSSAGLARKYGVALSVGLTVEDVESWLDTLQSVTEEDVMQAARMVFDRRKSVTGWAMSEERG